MTDDAKEVAATPAETAPKRPKSPAAYHVFQLVDGAWKHLTERAAVKATSRKAAIEKATERLEDKAGTFVAVKEAEWAPIPRKLEQKVESIWG
jgi:hypothetical protein